MDHPKFKRGSNGDLYLNFGEYGEEVEAAAISGDGRRLLTVREVGVACIWDVATGEKVAELRPTSSLDGRIGLACTTEEFRTFIESSDLNVDGTRALLGLNDRTAAVFDVASGCEVARLRSHGPHDVEDFGVVRAVAFSPDGMLALVGFFDRQVGVWSGDGSRLVGHLQAAEPDRLVRPAAFRDTLVSSVAVSDDNAYVFAGCVDMTAFVWELATKTVVFEAMEHAGITAGSSQEGPEELPPRDLALRYGAHNGAALWKTEFGAFVHQSDGPRGWVRPIRVDGGLAAVQTADGIAVFRVGNGRATFVASHPVDGDVRFARVANDGRTVVAVSRAGVVVRWSFDSDARGDG